MPKISRRSYSTWFSSLPVGLSIDEAARNFLRQLRVSADFGSDANLINLHPRSAQARYVNKQLRSWSYPQLTAYG